MIVMFCLSSSFAKKEHQMLGLCFVFLCLFQGDVIFIFARCFVVFVEVLMDSSEWCLFLAMIAVQTCVFI